MVDSGAWRTVLQVPVHLDPELRQRVVFLNGTSYPQEVTETKRWCTALTEKLNLDEACDGRFLISHFVEQAGVRETLEDYVTDHLIS